MIGRAVDGRLSSAPDCDAELGHDLGRGRQHSHTRCGSREGAILAAEYGWKIDLGTVARIWRGGCIIRASFLDRIRVAHAAEPNLVSLLTEEGFTAETADAQVPWRSSPPPPAAASPSSPSPRLCPPTTPCAPTGCPPPSSRARDYFGAHTYQRTERPGAFPTHWSQPDRPETAA